MLFVLVAESRALGWKPAAQRCGQFLWTLLPALVLGYLIMGLLWPWSVQSPLNPLHAAEYFDTFFEKPWQELYEGRLIDVPAMPASYLPHLFMLKLPEIMLALGLIGLVGAFIAAARRSVPVNRRATLMLVALAAIFPVALAMRRGRRSIMAYAISSSWCRRSRRSADWPSAGSPSSAQPAWQGRARRARRHLHRRRRLAGERHGAAASLRVHVLQRVWRAACAGAHGQYMLDYWGLAFKQAADELRARLAAGAEHPPQGRRWVVAICGPQSSAREELGPQFETTFDSKTADFVMSLGTFYCRHLTGADPGHDRARRRRSMPASTTCAAPGRRSCSPSRRRNLACADDAASNTTG